MKTLPFDLEKAKAGHPLVTRDGRPAKFCFCAEDWSPDCRVFVQIDGCTGQRTVAGQRFPMTEATDDVFLLAPEPKLRPWTKDEVPVDAWFLPPDGPAQHPCALRVTRFSPGNGAVWIEDCSKQWWRTPVDLLVGGWRYSQSARGPWLPCGVLE